MFSSAVERKKTDDRQQSKKNKTKLKSVSQSVLLANFTNNNALCGHVLVHILTYIDEVLSDKENWAGSRESKVFEQVIKTQLISQKKQKYILMETD